MKKRRGLGPGPRDPERRAKSMPERERHAERLLGLHREIWEGVDPDGYLERERASWEAGACGRPGRPGEKAEGALAALRGMLKGADGERLTDTLLGERALDREREERKCSAREAPARQTCRERGGAPGTC